MSDEPTFYHGTRAPFRGRGGIVVPGREVGRDNTTDSDGYDSHGIEYAGDRVYVTTDYELAAMFAVLAQGRGKPRVLTVAPVSGLAVDHATTYNGEERDDVFTCDFARVLATEMLDPLAMASLLVAD